MKTSRSFSSTDFSARKLTLPALALKKTIMEVNSSESGGWMADLLTDDSSWATCTA